MPEVKRVTGNFPKKFKELRKAKGWSQGQIAQKIGVEGARVSKYERGILYPTTEIMLRLVDVFKVSLDYILRDQEEPEINSIKNEDLFERVKELDRLPKPKQDLLIGLLDTFIKEHKLEQLIQS